MRLKTWILSGLLLCCTPAYVYGQESTEGQESAENQNISLPETAPAEGEYEEFYDGDEYIPSAEMMPVDENGEYFDDEYFDEADEEDLDDDSDYIPELELVADSEEAKLPNPVYVVQSIHLAGNTSTSEEQILKMLGINPGDKLTMDQIEDARVRLAMSGIFKSVDMQLRSGTERGTLKVNLVVSERSHLQVNQYTIGSSYRSPFWLGLDVSYLAPFGTDHRFRMAYGATYNNDYTLTMNYLIPTIERLPISLMFSLQSMEWHEGIYGKSTYLSKHESDLSAVDKFFSFLDEMTVQRHGASIGIGYAPIRYLRVMARFEYMSIHADTNIDTFHADLANEIKPHHSNLTTIEANVMYDSREGRELPNKGHFVMFGLKGTAKTSASDYEYFKMHLAHQNNFRVASQHIIRLNSFWGASWGDMPFFEKFFFKDFYTLAPSRFHMMNPSDRGAYDLFKTGASSLGYEDFIASIALSYAWQPLERQFEIFVLASATWANSIQEKTLYIGTEPTQSRDSFAADMSFNVGVRFKTDYGMFSIALSNFMDLVVR